MNNANLVRWIFASSVSASVVLFGHVPSRADPLLPEQSRPAHARGTIVVPEKFVRRWDPVTVFFDRDTAPVESGPEDHAEKYLTILPSHPGAFTWLDRRTLQFRPSVPWPPLARYALRFAGKSASIDTLMAAPIESAPPDGTESLDAISDVRLTFLDPIDPRALADMIAVELRPLPGTSEGGDSRVLDKSAFSLRSLEQKGPAEPASYLIHFFHPIPLGTHATVRLRLSRDADPNTTVAKVSFRTKESFRVLSIGCGNERLPLGIKGTHFEREQALRCASHLRSIDLVLSAKPGALGPVEATNLVQFTPPVDDLLFRTVHNMLHIDGRFRSDTLYKVSVAPAHVIDEHGRALDMKAKSSLFVVFEPKTPFLKSTTARGVLERFGPKTFPLQSRGDTKADLRIYAIDPFDRNFWPFGTNPIAVDTKARPPGPGEEPEPHKTAGIIREDEIKKHIETLGSPPVSSIVDLPIPKGASAGSYGLDLAPHLLRLSGENAPGTYLVGIERLDGSGHRFWSRIQVTDIALSTIEEPRAVRFVATSLQTARPIADATVRVEGSQKDRWVTFVEGKTNDAGEFVWHVPGRSAQDWVERSVHRIVVRHDRDVLVLDPTSAPDGFLDNQWSTSRESWLSWAMRDLAGRGEQEEKLCHVFTERPVYRPDEPVHIKGYLREREKRRLRIPKGTKNATFVLETPDNAKPIEIPLLITQVGSFYAKFEEKSTPTGHYRGRVVVNNQTVCSLAFRIEAYRTPEFEVSITGPDKVPLDAPFTLRLVATYYAGGRVSGRPVSWRVTQFPETWTPDKREGFLFSSDGRYSNNATFESRGTIEKTDVTTTDGSASITLDPSLEPTAAPRMYIVEATVTGADDQTVTTTRKVVALPPFVLGLSIPRVLHGARKIEPKMLALGHDGKPKSDVPVTVRLLMRQWHSGLQAADFSTGVAKYITDVVDEKIAEKVVKSASEAVPIPFELPRAGVYIVELEARDRLGRALVVRADFFATGTEPVAWAKPNRQVFAVATDKKNYDPGSKASIVLKSPFQKARALAVVEAPDQNRYSWIDIHNGSAVFTLDIVGAYAPRLPVHFLLIRGRTKSDDARPKATIDLEKPATLAATAWIDVNPLDHQIDVSLVYPERALPGSTVDVTIKLATPRNKKPLSGEVTLWLVDQAVLVLGHEQRLDPVPDFMTPVRAHVTLRDTRNEVLGHLPFAETPGGDGGGAISEIYGGQGLLDRVTVRRNFQTVPYYNPAIAVGPSGVAKVSVALPDKLTNFKIRAKAASGDDRFGVGVGMISVRMPLIVQPALPRFVRPGDRFTAAGIGRVVEGPGGKGKSEVRATGAKLLGPAQGAIMWTPNKPERVDVPIEVLTPGYDASGRAKETAVVVQMAVSRDTDPAKDAFEVRLPIRDDRAPTTRRALVEIKPGAPIDLLSVTEPLRQNSLKRTLVLSDQPALVRMLAGLDALRAYPYTCTEQRISRARAEIAFRKVNRAFVTPETDAELKRDIAQILADLPRVIDTRGLIGFWPGSRGYVSLTAWTTLLLVEGREAGVHIDETLLANLVRALEQSLRSDFSAFVDGEAWAERAWALSALASAGRFSEPYADELIRQATFLDVEGKALVLHSLARAGRAQTKGAEALGTSIMDRIVFRLHQGKEIYGGLRSTSIRSGLILPSETRTLGQVTRALYRSQAKHPKVPLLVNALVTLGQQNGWGSTNADAEAMLALSEVLERSEASTRREVALFLDAKSEALALAPGQSLATTSNTSPRGRVERRGSKQGPLILWDSVTYTPSSPGYMADKISNGFVVSREAAKVQGKDRPSERTAFSAPGMTLSLSTLDVIEEHVQVVNPQHRHHVAIVVPLAAGLEPLNPALLTAPPEARPSQSLTRAPAYVAYLDDSVAYFYDDLPSGTYDFYFRTRATTPGTFTQPPATAEMMYDSAVRGASVGARVEVSRREGT